MNFIPKFVNFSKICGHEEKFSKNSSFLSPFIFVTVFVIVIITSKNEQQQEAIEEREEKSNKS